MKTVNLKSQPSWSVLSLLFCAYSLVAPGVGWSQVEKVSVVGRVSDTTGASAPGAAIEIVRLATNEVHRSVSTSTGDYTLVDLAAGDYELRASLSGFKTLVRTGLRLETGRAHRIDLTLEVGQTSERVEVTAAAPLLRTESPETGALIDNSKVMQLPVRSRDYLSFVGLLPGVAPSRGSIGGGGLDTQGFNVLGQRRSDNLVFLDGATFTQSNGVTTFFPNLDALQEIEIKTGLYGAEFGVKPGAQILAVTKSGGNVVHGSLFEYYRNDKANARNFFDPGPPAVFKQHTFGATVGGPIFIPHVFNGKNKAWFFGGYNGMRLAAVQSLTGVVPTDLQKSGVFASAIKDPLSGQPFPNKTIPVARIGAASKHLIQFWPSPNTGGRGFNFTSPNSTANNTTDQYIIRVDFNVSDADHWSARFIHDNSPSVTANAIQTFFVPSPLSSWGQSISNTRTFGAAVVNEFGIHNFRRPLLSSPPRFNTGFGKTLSQYIAGFPANLTDADGVPVVNITGMLPIGDALQPGTSIVGSWEVRDSLSFHRGAHSFKAGYNWRRQFGFSQSFQRSSFTFIPRYSGDAYADFLLGNAASTIRGSDLVRANLVQNASHFYFQDDWTVTSRLTLTLGLRYEYRGPYRDKRGFATNFNPATGQLDPQQVSQSLQPWETGRYPANVPILAWTKMGILPRIGVAYRVTPKTVIRAGYGAYTNEPTGNGISKSYNSNPRTNAVVQTFLAPVNAATITLSDPFNLANAPGAGVPAIYGGQPVMQQSLVHSWGLTIQRQLDQHTVVEVGYQGSNGVHDPIIESFNDAVPGPGPIQQRRPYPQWQSINYLSPKGTNNVQALQARVERRPGPEGLSALLSYSWIKTFDTVGGRTTIPGEGFVVSRNVSAAQDRGMGEGSIPYRVALTLGYELPFGPGKALLSSGLAGKVIGGWSIQGITSIQGGPYVTAVMPSDTMGVGSTADFRPNAIQNPNLPASERKMQRWFNTAAFAAPAQYKYGNAGRSIVQAPGIFDVDLAILRFFPITERAKFELRLEAYNATNHPNFGLPGLSFGTPTFGVVGSTLGGVGRQVQIGARITF